MNYFQVESVDRWEYQNVYLRNVQGYVLKIDYFIFNFMQFTQNIELLSASDMKYNMTFLLLQDASQVQRVNHRRIKAH